MTSGNNYTDEIREMLSQCTSIACMNTKRGDACAAAHGGKLYVFGGFDEAHRLQSCEMYNPDTNKWTTIASMNTKRGGACAAAYGGKLYVLGGFDGAYRLQSCEMYNPDTNKWTTIASMSTKRSGACAAAHGGKLYVFGGFDGAYHLQSCEMFDPAPLSLSALVTFVCRQFKDLLEDATRWNAPLRTMAARADLTSISDDVQAEAKALATRRDAATKQLLDGLASIAAAAASTQQGLTALYRVPSMQELQQLFTHQVAFAALQKELDAHNSDVHELEVALQAVRRQVLDLDEPVTRRARTGQQEQAAVRAKLQRDAEQLRADITKAHEAATESVGATRSQLRILSAHLPEMPLLHAQSVLQQLLCQPYVSPREVAGLTHFRNFPGDSPVPWWMRALLEAMDQTTLRKWLRWSTGAYSPAPVTVFLQPNPAGVLPLPSAHTCFNSVDMYAYPSEEVLREKLLRAIEETEMANR